MRMPNLTPEEVRKPPLENGVRPVWWQRVDPWLKLVSSSGELKALSQQLGVSRTTLLSRRKKLELDPLPVGRPKARQLTLKQRNVVNKLGAGMTVKEVAAELGVSTQAVHATKTAAVRKQTIESKRCKRCEGQGVTPCFSCYGNAAHYHMCETCGGDGYVQ